MCVAMAREVTVYPPERTSSKKLVTLPDDRWRLIDECSKAMGMTSRSAFLQIYFDTYGEQVLSFTEGWLANIRYYQEKVDQEKRVEEGQKVAESLGQKTSIRKG